MYFHENGLKSIYFQFKDTEHFRKWFLIVALSSIVCYKFYNSCFVFCFFCSGIAELCKSTCCSLFAVLSVWLNWSWRLFCLFWRPSTLQGSADHPQNRCSLTPNSSWPDMLLHSLGTLYVPVLCWRDWVFWVLLSDVYWTCTLCQRLKRTQDTLELADKSQKYNLDVL